MYDLYIDIKLYEQNLDNLTGKPRWTARRGFQFFLEDTKTERIGVVSSNKLSTEEITSIFLNWYSKIRKSGEKTIFFDVIYSTEIFNCSEFSFKPSKNKKVWHSSKILVTAKYAYTSFPSALAFKLYFKRIKPLKGKIKSAAAYLTDENPEIRVIAASICRTKE